MSDGTLSPPHKKSVLHSHPTANSLDLYEHVCFKGYNLLYINPTLKDYERIKQYINSRRNYIKDILKKET